MWQSYMNFMADHGRRPSKYKPEERNLVNWLKYNRKEVNQGTFPESRKKMFDESCKWQSACIASTNGSKSIT